MSYGDNPIESTDQDRLERAPVVKALGSFVSRRDLDTPMTVGIYGEWGSGKTSVMKMLAEQLPDTRTVQFEAWKFGTDADALWRALITAIASALRLENEEEDADVEALLDNLYRSLRTTERGELRINWRSAFPLAIQTALGFVPGVGENLKNLSKWLGEKKNFKEALDLFEREERERYHAQIQSLEQFQEKLDELLESRITAPDRLYVFIDDLDRCLASAAVAILEAIKVFFRASGCVFILGLDRRIVEAGVKERHPAMSDADASEYLDKIVQVPFHLPPLDEPQMEAFVNAWCKDHDAAELTKDASLISIGVAPNPRKVKRTLNVLTLAHALRKAGGLQTDERLRRALTKVVVIQNSYEDVYRRAVENPPYLATLETAAHNGEADEALTRNPRLAALLRLEWNFTDRSPEELTDLLFLTRFGRTASP